MSLSYMREHPMSVLLAVGGVAVLLVLLTATNGGLLKSAVNNSSSSTNPSSSPFSSDGIYIEETVDAGFDPLNPGCMLAYSSIDAEVCGSDSISTIHGDECLNDNKLIEYNAAPECAGSQYDYISLAKEVVDCNVRCLLLGRGGGKCVATEELDYCGVINRYDEYISKPSAYCSCDESGFNKPSPSSLSDDEEEYVEAEPTGSFFEDEYAEAEPTYMEEYFEEEFYDAEPTYMEEYYAEESYEAEPTSDFFEFGDLF